MTFSIKFIDQVGLPIPHTKVSVINNSNILSNTMFGFTDHNGCIVFSYLSFQKEFSATIYLNYQRLGSNFKIKTNTSICIIDESSI